MVGDVLDHGGMYKLLLSVVQMKMQITKLSASLAEIDMLLSGYSMNHLIKAMFLCNSLTNSLLMVAAQGDHGHPLSKQPAEFPHI